MTPSIAPYDRRRYKRLYMATRDCYLTLMRWRDGEREREVCTLLDLSYAGLHFRARQALAQGDEAELWIELRGLVNRSAFAKVRIRWIRRSGPDECYVGAEFSEGSKGSLLGPEETEQTLYGRSGTSNQGFF